MLYRSQKVRTLEIDPDGPSWHLQGEVQGSQREPYEVWIDMALTPDGKVAFWDSDCECPVCINCKHGVALMLKAAYQGLQLMDDEALARVKTPPPAANPAQIEARRQESLEAAAKIARLEAEAQLLRWLQEIDQASGKTVAAPGFENSERFGYKARQPDRAEQYLYLLTLVSNASLLPRLQLSAVVSYPKVSGGWAKTKALKIQPYTGQAVYDQASPTDREVLQLMRALPGLPGSYGYYGSYSAKVMPDGQTGQLALQLASQTGRLFVDAGGATPGQPIAWGPAQALSWDWQETLSPKSASVGWALRAKLTESPAQLCLNTPPLYLDAERGLCGPVQAEGVEPAALNALLKAPPIPEAALQKHQLALIQRLGSLPLPPSVQGITPLQGITPRALLQLTPTAPQDIARHGLITARLRFDYAGHRGWWIGADATVLLDTPTGRILLQRDLPAEQLAITHLAELGLLGNAEGEFTLHGDWKPHTWLHWADADYAELRAAGFELSVDAALDGWISHADTLSVQMQAHGQGEGEGEDEATSPWFDLSLGMEINGQRHNILPWLPELIAAAAASPLDPATGQPEIPPFIFLPDLASGGFIRLPTETLRPWMAALLELVGDRAHDFSGDSLKLSRLDALRASAALGEGAVWEGAASLRTLVSQLSGKVELPKITVPKGVKAELRPYQRQGLAWLQFLREHGLAGILADDMGLGKTLQTLAHIQVEKDAGRLTHPALIIAPVSLMGNWRREAERFCPGLRSLVLHGAERHDAAHSMAEHDIVIAPYSLLQRDRERWLEAQWHLVVLDEAQNIKNASTHAAQVVSQLQTRHRLCLSGTPMENHLGEIWSLFHFLMPGFLGSQQRFKELFRTPIEKQGDPDRMAQLRARITPFMLRRTKALVAKDLPPKVETVVRVELSGKQADLYETIRLGMEKTVREALDAKGLAKSQITILDALLKLRQVCCDPKLIKLAAAQKVKTSAKLEHLMELLPEMLAEGRRVLLFSQFTSMLTLIEAELKKRNIPWVKLTGQSQKRDALIEQFTNGVVPLFLISLKAGGVGLNLPQADTVIHYDPWWNPAVETQATDRAHRIGQTQSVFVYKLVAQGTIEERILALQERKAALAQSMYSGSVARKQPLFTEGDLAELLKPLSA